VSESFSLRSPNLWAAMPSLAVQGVHELVDTPEVLVRVKLFTPGETFGNHYHEGFDEIFVGLDGHLTVWLNESDRVTLTSGVSMTCIRGDRHLLVNESAEPATILVVKAPNLASDTTWVEWAPDRSDTQHANQSLDVESEDK
jgi:quercetin dioxygenase-like cupin family protein